MTNIDTSASLSGNGIDRNTALELAQRSGPGLFDLFALANRVREKFRGDRVDLCSIINAKSGACPEDCSFCAQSAHTKTDVDIYPLVDREKILKAAASSKENGVKRFCIVTSGRDISDRELGKICSFISDIRSMGLLPCATLGLLTSDNFRQLKDAGLHRYHHNLETSENFFSEICSTHTFRDKIKTIEAARSVDLSVCSGGIFGLGESWEDRVDMALAIKETGADSVPINFLSPVKGTQMDDRQVLPPLEALKIIAIYRLILPRHEIRICGGRPQALRELNAFIFSAGASGLLMGNYLTTTGRQPEDDLQLIHDMGLVY